MKTTFRSVLLLTMLFALSLNFHLAAQNTSSVHSSPAIKDGKNDFQGKFAIKTGEDETNRYYQVDYTRLSSRFEKIWFMNESFTSDKVVNTDSDINHQSISFLANKKFSEKEILDYFDLILKNTLDKSASMTKEEQKLWLEKNDKYK